MRAAIQRFRLRSDDLGFVLRLVAGILLLGVAVSYVVSLTAPRSAPPEMKALVHSLHMADPTKGRAGIPDLMDDVREILSLSLRYGKFSPSAPDDTKPPEPASPLPDKDKRKGFLDEWKSILTKTEFDTILAGIELLMPGHKVTPADIAPFSAAAAASPVSAVLCSVEAMLLRASGNPDAALSAWERGAADPEAGAECMLQSMYLCRVLDRTAEFREMYARPAWREASRQAGAHELMAAAWDFPGLVESSVISVVSGFRSPALLGLLALGGLTWFLVIFRVTGLERRLIWMGLLALLAGVASVVLTDVFIALQETHSGIREADDPADSMIFYLCGVGLREEAAKLLLFLPFLALLRRSSAADALGIACCVGLGFAITENTHYVSTGSSPLGRHMTANLLHLVCTGLAGCAVFCAWHWPRHYFQRALLVLPGVVFIHGMWDWILTHPVLASGDKGYLSFFAIFGIMVLWLNESRRCRQQVPPGFAAWAIYLYGAALIIAGSCIVSATTMTLRESILESFGPALSSAVMGAVMTRRLLYH